MLSPFLGDEDRGNDRRTLSTKVETSNPHQINFLNEQLLLLIGKSKEDGDRLFISSAALEQVMV